jgi:hypothetical protein
VLTAVKESLPEQSLPRLLKVIEEDVRTIGELLKAIWLTKSCSVEIEELVVGYGELW